MRTTSPIRVLSREAISICFFAIVPNAPLCAQFCWGEKLKLALADQVVRRGKADVSAYGFTRWGQSDARGNAATVSPDGLERAKQHPSGRTDDDRMERPGRRRPVMGSSDGLERTYQPPPGRDDNRAERPDERNNALVTPDELEHAGQAMQEYEVQLVERNSVPVSSDGLWQVERYRCRAAHWRLQPN